MFTRCEISKKKKERNKQTKAKGIFLVTRSADVTLLPALPLNVPLVWGAGFLSLTVSDKQETSS